MRKVICFLFVINLNPVFAQYQSLKTDYEKPAISWIAAPIMEFERNESHFAVFGGAEFGLILEKKYLFGVYYSTALTGIYPDGFDDRSYYKNYFDQGGLFAGYVVNPNHLIHTIFHVRAGIGNFAIGEDLGNHFNNLELYILQPSIGLELNISPKLRTGLGLFYRIVNPVDLFIYKDASLNAVGLSLTIRTGNFD